MKGRTPGSVIVVGQVIPDEFAAYLRGSVQLVSRADVNALLAAAHDAGWTLTALGKVLGVSREMIRRRMEVADVSRWPTDRIPDPPRWPARPVPPPRVEVPEPDAARLRALHARAVHVNGATPDDHPDRLASEEMSRLLAELWDEGAGYPINALARALRVTHSAVALRLSRFGFRAPVPSQPPYLGQATRGPRTKCPEGHDLTGDNVIRRQETRGLKRLCRICYEGRRRGG